MVQPTISQCFHCNNQVFEFDENHFGCDTCKSVYKWNGKGWENLNKTPLKIQLASSFMYNDDSDTKNETNELND